MKIQTEQLQFPRGAILQLLDKSLFQHIWIKWTAGYQVSAEITDMIMSAFKHFIQLCWRGDASKGCRIVALEDGHPCNRVFNEKILVVVADSGRKTSSTDPVAHDMDPLTEPELYPRN